MKKKFFTHIAPVPLSFKEKKLKSDQNYSVQVNLSIGIFFDALRSENFERVYLETTF